MGIRKYDNCGSVLVQMWTDSKRDYKNVKKLSINEGFVFRTIKRHWETDDIEDRPWEGHPRSIHTPKLVHAVREWMRQNPLCKQKLIDIEINVSKRSVSHILYDT